MYHEWALGYVTRSASGIRRNLGISHWQVWRIYSLGSLTCNEKLQEMVDYIDNSTSQKNSCLFSVLGFIFLNDPTNT